jgi:hypothetical protein
VTHAEADARISEAYARYMRLSSAHATWGKVLFTRIKTEALLASGRAFAKPIALSPEAREAAAQALRLGSKRLREPGVMRRIVAVFGRAG